MSRVRGAIALITGLALVACGLVAVTLLRAGHAGSAPAHQIGPATRAPRVPSAGPSALSAFGRRSGFVHPGVLVSIPQLTFVRDQVRGSKEPWATAFDAMASSRYASLSWRPRPRPVVECGPYSVPNLGCEEEESDAVAAYTHALLWFLTGERANADKAVEILDAWSGVLRQHSNRNAPLQAGWSGATFVRAAELIKHTYDGWATAHADRAAAMFRSAFLPLVIGGAPHAGGNWELIMLDAAVGIAVFLDDRSTFTQALAKLRARVRAYVYITSDGRHPKSPPGGPATTSGLVAYWAGQTTFVSGLSQETCRDFGHAGWGLAAIAHVAETARLQGVDLYAELRERLTSALEFHATYELGEPAPPWLCGGKVTLGLHPIPEVAYHHYAVRMGLSLPRTGRFIESARPAGAAFFYGWETLTHANNEH